MSNLLLISELMRKRRIKMSIENLEQEIELLKREYEKFERGNKSAGTRARKILQNIKRVCQDMRVEIQDSKKTES